MSTRERLPCPKDCGWAEGNPELDEQGVAYTCFLCGNTGEVYEDPEEVARYKAAVQDQ